MFLITTTATYRNHKASDHLPIKKIKEKEKKASNQMVGKNLLKHIHEKKEQVNINFNWD